MQIRFNATITSPVLMLVLAMGLTVTGKETDQQQREQIGEVLGRPVYRDEIRVGKDVSLSDELHRLFTAPVTQQYRQTHKDKIAPTLAEIAAATKHFDNQHRERIKGQEPALRRQLKSVKEQLTLKGLTEENKQKLTIEKMTLQARLNPPGKSFAAWMLNNRKFQLHLHQTYGGGRILFQQAGMEAFDATQKWLETLERDGKFKISDPKLRSVLYHYWTTQNHGPFLMDDKKRIHEFLEPEWMKQSPSQD
ncbi:hypothetical protein CA13_10920 [Planctomycetes bacterium CA13]|uniref:Uncharacterized protein n=1 Tax=Novipirellula herctigrandis TaxID=2527986 RepID=A0A5C5YYD0_9BACT|nr:hypothetical protein CA13_10920 [Planctomycetes bacterium CA13]